MGKKDKKKNKVSGSTKTALKTEKKLNAKQKKQLAELGEDDVEKIVAEIEAEEARRQHVVETRVDQPLPRVNFTLTAHPFKDEIIMLGGEFYDGQKTVVYGDMFFYNINKNEWTLVKAPGAPPPRCGHQTVAVPSNKGELWVFGGEYSSPSESQFYHYRDLWVYHIGIKKWEKITSPGGPSARSGHRMVYIKKQLFVFGGFHDNIREYKYYNDVHIFSLETYKWAKLELSGNLPAPRSGCIVLPTPENKILVYGGYSKERIKKDVDKGIIHTDMFILNPEKNDQTGLKWKWKLVKQSGIKISPRCSASGILVQSNLAYLFGGVFDEEDNEEELSGTFYNDLMALDLDKFQWREVTVSGKKESNIRRRRRKLKEGNSKNESNSDSDYEEDNDEDLSSVPSLSSTTDTDGIFTVTIGPSQVSNTCSKQVNPGNVFSPSPRINPGLVVKQGVLYLYGGMIEDGDRQYTLSDFYSLDCRKLDEWKTVIKNNLSSQVWLESDSSDSTSDNDSDDHDDDNDEMNSEQEKMETD